MCLHRLKVIPIREIKRKAALLEGYKGKYFVAKMPNRYEKDWEHCTCQEVEEARSSPPVMLNKIVLFRATQSNKVDDQQVKLFIVATLKLLVLSKVS